MGGVLLMALVRLAAIALRMAANLVRNASRLLVTLYDVVIAVPLLVERVVKGGYEVRVARQRAFCPLSQIDVVRTTDPAVHEGHVYTFRIIEFKDGGRNLVVSRRAVLEEEQRARAADVWNTIEYCRT